jgi:hypothetical protein
MSDFFSSIGGTSSNSFYDSFFGGGTSSMNSLLGDYSMIKSGAYTKLLKKYYAENPVTRDEDGNINSIKDSQAADTNKNLLAVKDSAQKTADAAKAFTELDFSDPSKVKREDLLEDMKGFVENYNSMLDDMDNIESVTLLQNAVWMTSEMKRNANALENIGIKIGSDNKLSIDETVFNGVSDNVMKSVFTGSHSIMDSVSRRASQIYNMAGTQAIMNSKNTSYNSTGGYKAPLSSNLINSLM